MKKPKFKQCDRCRSYAVRYRMDYPPNDPRAYIIIHARGCSRLTVSKQQHWTPAKLAVLSR